MGAVGETKVTIIDDDYEKGGTASARLPPTNAASAGAVGAASGAAGGGIGNATDSIQTKRDAGSPWLAVGTVSIMGEAEQELLAGGSGGASRSRVSVVQFSAKEHKVHTLYYVKSLRKT